MIKKNFIIILIILIGIILRVYGLQYGLPSQERINYYFPQGVTNVSFSELFVYGMLGTAHPDEADMVGAVSNMKPSKFDFNPHFFSYGGCLYFFMLALIWKAASLFKLITLDPGKYYYFLNPAEIAKMYLAGKFAVVLFGAFTALITYSIGKILYDKKTGIFSAAFISILPWHVFLSHFMLPDVIVTFWVALALLFCAGLIKSRSIKWYLLSGAAAGFAVATKYNALLLVFPIILAHMLSMDKPVHKKGYLFFLFDKKLAACFMVMFSLAFIAGNPYMVVSFKETMNYLFRQSSEISYGKFLPPTPGIFFVNIFKNVFTRSLVFLNVGLSHFQLFLLLCGIVYAFFKKSKFDMLVLGWVIPYYILISGFQWCSVAYFLPMLPFLIILIFRFLFKAKEISKKIIFSGLFITIIIIILFSQSFLDSLKIGNMMSRKDTRMYAAEWISKNIPKNSIIALTWDARQDAYYTAPPLSSARYKLKALNTDFLRSDLLGVDYVVLTGVLQMQAEPQLGAGFREIKAFNKNIDIFGINFLKKEPFSESYKPVVYGLMKSHKRIFRTYDFIQPTIKIFKRVA